MDKSIGPDGTPNELIIEENQKIREILTEIINSIHMSGTIEEKEEQPLTTW